MRFVMEVPRRRLDVGMPHPVLHLHNRRLIDRRGAEDVPPGRRQIVGAVFHLSDAEQYRRLNDVVCVRVGEVRARPTPTNSGLTLS